MQKPLNIIFLGLSGSGKGTQVRLCFERLSGVQKTKIISTGAFVRELQNCDSEIGRRVRDVLSKGGLLPSVVAIAEWMHHVNWDVQEQEGMFFEGSPRKILEAQLVDDVLDFMDRKDSTKIVYLRVHPEKTRERLLHRGRYDDIPEAIEERIAYFKEHVVPLIEYYRSQGRLIEIDGEQTVEKVHADIISALGI